MNGSWEGSKPKRRSSRADGNETDLEIAIEDLRGSKQAVWDQKVVGERLRNQVVMVTGAAGSIGSELCRQIAGFEPQGLVGMDCAETPLYRLQNELATKLPRGAFHPVLGNVACSRDLEEAMTEYGPTIVFHAAAYKHVSMLETQISAAVENNILATWRVALAAMEHGVESFVLISTDKAVRPASLMGATKRVAELMVRGLQSDDGTKFSTVRFGNVLGSSGSVALKFKEQIAAGGPVTITHAEMRRYFMTSEEAANFVLQAWAMAEGGDIFLLDMGEPVRILDLARKMIESAAIEHGCRIEVAYTGMLPGEKLCEELKLVSERQISTGCEGISRLASFRAVEKGQMEELVEQLERAFEARDRAGMTEWIQAVVPEFTHAAQNFSSPQTLP